MSDAWAHRAHPWEPPDCYTETVIYAVRAWREGTATQAQQLLAWEWVQFLAASGDGYQDLSYRPGPDGARETDFAEGKRFVGLQLRKLLRAEVTPKTVRQTGKTNGRD